MNQAQVQLSGLRSVIERQIRAFNDLGTAFNFPAFTPLTLMQTGPGETGVSSGRQRGRTRSSAHRRSTASTLPATSSITQMPAKPKVSRAVKAAARKRAQWISGYRKEHQGATQEQAWVAYRAAHPKKKAA